MAVVAVPRSWLLAPLWVGSAWAATRPDPALVEGFLRRQAAQRQIPGMQVVVVQGGEVVFSGAYGLANVQDQVPVTPGTVFPLNSITKAFTGVALMQLVEAGTLELDAPVSRYLPGLPRSWQRVSLRQLATHTSGLPDVIDPGTEALLGRDFQATWKLVQARPPESGPGARFRYNQLGYVLLGKVIEKVTGKPFVDLVTQGQLAAVPLPATSFGDALEVVPRAARAYSRDRDSGGLKNAFEPFPRELWTAAGLNSTAEDLARWLLALQRGKLLAPASLTALWTPGTLADGSHGGFTQLLDGYALGWVTTTRAEHRAVGGIGGGRSVLLVYPEDELALIVLTNLRGSLPEAFIEEFAGLYLPALEGGYGPAINALRPELERGGYQQLPALYQARTRERPGFRLAEGEVNAWGYRLLAEHRVPEAVAVLQLNVTLHPTSSNAHDSLGEAFLAAGDRPRALLHYRRSLELDPRNGNAADQVKQLRPRPEEASPRQSP